MDRYTTNIAAAQGGFIDGFIRPAFEILQKILPEVMTNIKQMNLNKEQWKMLEDDYAPENKFTQKEIEKGKAEESVSSDEEEESEEDLEASNIEAEKILRHSTEQATRKNKYTHNSSTPNRDERMSTF